MQPFYNNILNTVNFK